MRETLRLDTPKIKITSLRSVRLPSARSLQVHKLRQGNAVSAHAIEPDFALIFNHLPDLYLVLKPDFTMVAANEARLKATMTTREGTLGKNLFDLFPDNPDEPNATGVANLRASLKRVVATKQPDTMAVQKYDIPRPESEGGGFEERYWSPMNAPVLDDHGEMTYIVHRVEDVTEFVKLKQKGLEQSRLTEDLQARLQRTEVEVFRRAQELQEANTKLRALDQVKSEFFANVSHELRTPLTLILAPAEALLDEPSVMAAPVLARTIKTMHNNALRLLHMINGLLDFSKVASGKTEVRRESVDIVELTRSILSDFRSAMESRGLTAELEAQLTAPLVEMDRYLYERIVFNLLSNAMKFTPAGGRIRATLSLTGDQLTLAVSDTGIGIAEKDQEHLFEKFHQVEGSATRRFEGTGLGLALVREFSHLLGGGVALKSGVGQGSTFTFNCKAPRADELSGAVAKRGRYTLQRPAVPFASDEESVPPSKASGELPRLLVAEDNPELSAFIASLLAPYCVIRIVSNGADALEMARRWMPDLVLSDVMMPRMSGIQLTRELKKSKECSGIPVVLLTAMTNRESLVEGWEAGADDYLFKPFHPREIEARIRSLLAGQHWKRKSEALRRQRDSLEQFTHIASHDLREPLRKIMIFTKLLAQQGNRAEGESADHLGVILTAASHMYKMIDSLTEYSSLECAEQAPASISLDAVLASVLTSMEHELRAVGACVQVGKLPELELHPAQASSLIQNLVSNALKYRVEGRPPCIRVNAEKQGSEWVLAISDNGIGFDPAYKDRIFIMFERLHANDKYPGVGMGLAICRRIVENHGGRIWAESEPGVGSTFYFSLKAPAGAITQTNAGE